VLEGDGDAGTSRDNPPGDKADEASAYVDPEGFMLIWAWIKRRRAAKAAKLAASTPTTENPAPAPPPDSPR